MNSVFHPSLINLPPQERLHRGIVAVDPGPHFGVATYHPFPGVPGKHFDLYTYELEKDSHYQVWDILEEHRNAMRWIQDGCKVESDGDHELVCGDTVLIVEKFEFRKDDAELRSRIDFTAAEYVGIAKLYGIQKFHYWIAQGASEAKAFWTDDKLRHLGLYGDTRHSRDALRHLLKYMAFTRHEKWLLEMLGKGNKG